LEDDELEDEDVQRMLQDFDHSFRRLMQPIYYKYVWIVI